MPLHRLIARTLRGLEDVAADEIRATVAPACVAPAHREVRFVLPALDPRLLTLGTVDDVFLVVRALDRVPCGRAALATLAGAAAGLDLDGAVAALRTLRPLAPPATVAVTASALGHPRLRRADLEAAVADELAAGGRRRGRHDEADVALRVHLDHDRATLMLRVAAAPLHRRDGPVARPGALHPPLGHAMARLLAPRAGETVLDPTTGTGTLLVELLRVGPRVRALGFDLDGRAVAAAHRRVGRGATVRVGDAARLPLADGAVDAVLVNPPWGRATAAAGGLRRDPGRLWTELARVLADGGRGVALLPATAAAPPALGPLTIVAARWVRLAGAPAWVIAFAR